MSALLKNFILLQRLIFQEKKEKILSEIIVYFVKQNV